MSNNPDTRAAILEAAKRLFVKSGYHKVSMRSLAKEAGISTGPLYFHFQNKSEVFFAICHEGLERLNETIRRAAALVLPDAMRLREIFLAFGSFYSNEPMLGQIVRMSFNPLSGIDFTTEQRDILFAKRLEHMTTMLEVIENGIKNSELQNMDPTRFMLVFYALGQGIFTSHEMGVLRHFDISVMELFNEVNRLTYTGIMNRGD